ncbi:MAG TPA: WYL domain-containing protein [Acidimicrobiia bacterium]|nr:WYL domain-containing protein [Acidimicrobiia bacterium]
MTSPRTVSRLARILALVPYVLSRDSVDVEEILDRFGYTEADLSKDLNTLFVCGLPGYGPGDLMEAYIDENEVIIDAADYFARAPRLTSTEALGLLAAGLAIIGSGQANPTLAGAVAKLTKVVIPEAEAAISVEVAGELETVGLLRQAAREQTAVRITYRSLSREEETVREIEPWSVFATLGNWYVQAYCHLVEAERVFRVDRIRSMEATDSHFERPEGVPEPGVSYSPSDDDIVCRLGLSPSARWVLDYYPVELVSESKQETVISFSSPDVQIPARLLLRLGSAARFISGDEVRATVAEIGKKLLAIYA